MALDKASSSTQETFSSLATYQFILLKTFRKNGEAVPTPVWFAYEDGALYVMTVANTGKVKRIRNNGRVLLAPCSRTGEVLGGEVAGQASILPTSEHQHATQLLAKKYGLLYRIFMFVGNLRKSERAYIKIVAG